MLVDQPARLAAHSLDERRVTQPTALRSGGWRVVQVLATEWESDPDEVVRRLVAAVGVSSCATLSPSSACWPR